MIARPRWSPWRRPGPAFPTGSGPRFEAVVGTEHVLVEPDVVGQHEVDWTGRFRGVTPAVIRPRDTAEVAAVLALCDAERIAVVPQGGNTGLVGGGVPLHGEIVLSLRRLDRLGPVDDVAAQVDGGGRSHPRGRCRRHVAAHGLAYGVDLAARGSATVGGTVATNAGGVHVLRWGATRRQVVGIEAVTADGRVLRHMDGLVKDNTGYDLAGLLCGSEGTLAVVTAARLALVPRFTERVVALCAFTDVADRGRGHRCGPASGGASSTPPSCSSATGWPSCVRSPVGPVRSAPTTRCTCCSRRPGPTTRPTPSPPRSRTRPGCSTSRWPPTPCRRAELWAYREEHTAAINTLGPPHKLDVTLPLAGLAAFVAAVPTVVAARGARRPMLDLRPRRRRQRPRQRHRAGSRRRVSRRRGARRGRGRRAARSARSTGSARRSGDGCRLQRSPEELAVFRSIKKAFDPNGILNPHVLL